MISRVRNVNSDTYTTSEKLNSCFTAFDDPLDICPSADDRINSSHFKTSTLYCFVVFGVTKATILDQTVCWKQAFGKDCTLKKKYGWENINLSSEEIFEDDKFVPIR